MLGHAQRNAIKARIMGRADWLKLASEIRKAYRAKDTRARAGQLGRELSELSGCDIGLIAWHTDTLDSRAWRAGTHCDIGANRSRDPNNTAGIPGMLVYRWVRYCEEQQGA